MFATVRNLTDFMNDWDRHAPAPELWYYDDDELEIPDLSQTNAEDQIDLSRLGFICWQGYGPSQAPAEGASFGKDTHPYLADRKSFKDAYRDWVRSWLSGPNAKPVLEVVGGEDDQLEAFKRENAILREALSRARAHGINSVMIDAVDAAHLAGWVDDGCSGDLPEVFSPFVKDYLDRTSKPEKLCPSCNGLGADPKAGTDCGDCAGGGVVDEYWGAQS